MDVIRPILTVDALAQLPDDGKRYEILGGDLAVSLSPKPKHQSIIRQLSEFCVNVQLRGLGTWYPSPLDVILNEYNVVQPDVLFIRADRLHIVTDANVQGAPDLVVEVLSAGTRERDLGVKAHLYARFQVPEYWVVDPEEETVTVYRLTEDGYHIVGSFRSGDMVDSPLFPDIPLVVADVFRA